MELDVEIRKLDELLLAEKNAHKNDPAYLDILCSDSSEFETDDEDSDNNSSVEDSPAENTVGTLLPFDNELSEIISATDQNLSQIVPYLTYEEYNIINNCKDLSLKELLILNQTKKIQLRVTARKFSSMLMQCNNQIRIEEDNNREKKGKKGKHMVRIGYPYIRDDTVSPYAHNEEKKRMLSVNEINTVILPKRIFWNVSQQINLKSGILWKYSKDKLEFYENQLEDLIGSLKEGCKEIIQASNDLENWRSKMKSNSLDAPPLWDDSFINWDEFAVDQLADPEMSKAARAFWNLYLHPDINKSAYTEEESAAIISMAVKYGGQNWDAIAVELGNNRSPYSLCVHYMTNLCESYNQYPFTKEEDNLLRSTIRGIRVGHVISWNKVVAQFDGRSREQLYNRYVHFNNMNYITGKFSDGEDIMLLCLVRKYGENFNKISAEIPTRSKAQLMDRYFGSLKYKDMLFGSYTVEEDKTILDHVEKYNGSRKWSELSTMIKRNSAHLRLRYSVLKKFFTKHPDKTLYDISRRKESRTLNDEYARKHKLADQLSESNILPNLEIENKGRSNKGGRPQRTLIDNELINFFRTTARIQKYRPKKTVHEEQLKKCASTIDAMLKMLGVKLDIPKKLNTASGVLENVDVELLNILREQPTTSSATIEDIPPNISTTQGLRALLLWHKKNKKDKKAASGVKPGLHMKKFHERFGALFRWPCLMSITQPEQRIVDGEEPERAAMVERKQFRNNLYKGRGRPKKNLNKVAIMNKARKRVVDDNGEKHEGNSEFSNIQTMTIHVPVDWKSAGESGTSKMYGGNKKVAIKKDVKIDPNISGIIEKNEDMKTDISKKLVSSKPDLSSVPTVVNRCKPPQPSTSSIGTGKPPVAYLKVLDKATVARLKLENKLNVVTSLKTPDHFIKLSPDKTALTKKPVNKKVISTNCIDLPSTVPSNTTITPSYDSEINIFNVSHLPVQIPADAKGIGSVLDTDNSETIDDPSPLTKSNTGSKTHVSGNKQYLHTFSKATVNKNKQLKFPIVKSQPGATQKVLEIPKAPLTTVTSKQPNIRAISTKPPAVKATTRISSGVKNDTQPPIILNKHFFNPIATGIKRKLVDNGNTPIDKRVKTENIETPSSPDT